MEKEIIKAIKLLLKDIRKNCISKEHLHSDIDWDCVKCKFKILDGGLEWYLREEEKKLLDDYNKRSCFRCGKKTLDTPCPYCGSWVFRNFDYFEGEDNKKKIKAQNSFKSF